MFSIILAAVIGIAILSFLVIIHELGHFFVARAFGVRVLEFGIGFPFLGSIFKIKRGETTYSVNWLLFGGFVQLYGEEAGSKEGPESFASKPVWVRILIAATGALVNLALAVILFTILTAASGFNTDLQSPFPVKFPFGTQSDNAAVANVAHRSGASETGLAVNDKIISINNQKITNGLEQINSIANANVGKNLDLKVANVITGKEREVSVVSAGTNYALITSVASKSPAAQAGLKEGDKIISVDGKPITDAQKIRSLIKEKSGSEITIVVQNLDGSSARTIQVTPRKNPPAGQGSLGVTLDQGAPLGLGVALVPNTTISYDNLGQKILSGFLQSGNMLYFQWVGLKSFIGQSFKQGSIEPLASQAAGPVGIVAVLGILVQNSGAQFLKVIATFMALISLILGIGNLLPIPAVDGGRIFFFLIEAVTRKKVNPKVENLIHGVGFVILLLLMALITANDIFKIFTGHLFG